MAITLDISTGDIDEGETKTLTVTPKDSGGTAFAPTTLTAVFTPPSGTADSYALGDFTNTSNVYTLKHTFDEAGKWAIKVTGTDSEGNVEIESGTVFVQQ